jgi:hypothetical protein
MYDKGDEKPLEQYRNDSNRFLANLILGSYDSVLELLHDGIHFRPGGEVPMNVPCCLADVAKYELKVLIHQAKVAVNGLEHQRQSVLQAVVAAQNAGESLSLRPDEMDSRLMELADSVCRLEHVLNQAMHEIERLEANHSSPQTSLLVFWSIRPDLVPTMHSCQEDLSETDSHLPQPVAFWSPPGMFAAVSMQYR